MQSIKSHLPLLSLVLGLLLFLMVLFPVIQYTWWEIFDYHSTADLVSASNVPVLGVSVSPSHRQSVPYKEFKLTVPKLYIKDDPVLVDSNDIDSGLVQLPGSALPGEVGNTFISGHSSIPLLSILHGKKAIFNNLEKLRVGDSITATVFGQDFKYIVQGMNIVDPHTMSVVNPPDSQGRYLTLMTCVPPGFSTKRLIVLAKLGN